ARPELCGRVPCPAPPPPPLDPNKQYEIALVEATLLNSWHNVTALTSRSPLTRRLASGAPFSPPFCAWSSGSCRSEMTLRNTLRVRRPQLDHTLLVFAGTSYAGDTETTFTGLGPVDMTSLQQLLFPYSLVGDSSLKGPSCQLPPGYLLEAKPNELVNVPVNRSSLISRFWMRVIDQAGLKVDLHDECMTYYIRLRKRRACGSGAIFQYVLLCFTNTRIAPCW
ncbi:MAG: hypothetical protein AB2556_26715, partial [Candidatus Thiodiazotropha sp.]